MIQTQEQLTSLLDDLDGVGLGESPRARIRRYVEEFMGTLPEDKRKTPPPLYCTPETFRLHQAVAFFHWMKGRGKDVKIMVSSFVYSRSPCLHVWYKDGSADFFSRQYFDSSESARGDSIFAFEFFDSPEEITFASFPYNFLADYDPNFWKTL